MFDLVAMTGAAATVLWIIAAVLVIAGIITAIRGGVDRRHRVDRPGPARRPRWCQHLQVTTSGRVPDRTRPGTRSLLLDPRASPELVERLPEDPRDVHLRDPDLVRDLRLGHVPEEP